MVSRCAGETTGNLAVAIQTFTGYTSPGRELCCILMPISWLYYRRDEWRCFDRNGLRWDLGNFTQRQRKRFYAVFDFESGESCDLYNWFRSEKGHGEMLDENKFSYVEELNNGWKDCVSNISKNRNLLSVVKSLIILFTILLLVCFSIIIIVSIKKSVMKYQCL